MATIASYTSTSAFSWWICNTYTWDETNYGETKISQTFVVIDGNWNVARIYFYMSGDFRDGSEAGDVTVEVRKTNEEGELLGTFTKNRLTITDAGWYYFEVTDLTLSSGNTYCLVVSCPHGFYNADDHEYDCIYIVRNPAAGYADGIGRHYNDVDGWSADFSGDPTVDFCFIVTGDVAVPSKATTPTPANTATNVTLDQAAITWVDGGGADTYNVYYGTTSGDLGDAVSSAQAGTSFTVSNITDGSPYSYLVTRYWRIDSTNAAGTTTGDEWSFTTLRFSPPAVIYYDDVTGQHYQLLVDANGDYGDHPAGGGGAGVEGTDFEYLAATYSPNFIATRRILVGAANDKIWIEDL